MIIVFDTNCLDMDKIRYSLVFNRKGKLTKDNKGIISICAYQSGKRKYFSTSIKVKAEEWDKKRQRIKPNISNYVKLNNLLNEMVAKLEDYELSRLEKGKSVSLDELSEVLNPNFSKDDFLLFFDKVVSENKSITLGTKKVYHTTYKHLQGFKSSIRFSDLDYRFLIDLENYLRDKGINPNTLSKYMKVLKAVVNKAINYDFIDVNKNPFLRYTMKSAPTSRTHLEPSEIERIEKLTFSEDKKGLEKIRDMYLFAVYSGLRFSDVTRLGEHNIKDIEGKIYIVLKMEKTKEDLRLPIYMLFNGKPINLLKKHTRENRCLFFDDFTNQYVNRELKKIAVLAGIKGKNLTFHTARHTTATYLMYKGVSMAVVQKILGHTKITTTQIYAKVMDMTTEKELEKVFS